MTSASTVPTPIQSRVLQSGTDFPDFDRYFPAHVSFIRSVRASQTMPQVPEEVTADGVFYLVQKLSGTWEACIMGTPPAYLQVQMDKRFIVWMH